MALNRELTPADFVYTIQEGSEGDNFELGETSLMKIDEIGDKTLLNAQVKTLTPGASIFTTRTDTHSANLEYAMDEQILVVEELQYGFKIPFSQFHNVDPLVHNKGSITQPELSSEVLDSLMTSLANRSGKDLSDMSFGSISDATNPLGQNKNWSFLVKDGNGGLAEEGLDNPNNLTIVDASGNEVASGGTLTVDNILNNLDNLYTLGNVDLLNRKGFRFLMNPKTYRMYRSANAAATDNGYVNTVFNSDTADYLGQSIQIIQSMPDNWVMGSISGEGVDKQLRNFVAQFYSPGDFSMVTLNIGTRGLDRFWEIELDLDFGITLQNKTDSIVLSPKGDATPII